MSDQTVKLAEKEWSVNDTPPKSDQLPRTRHVSDGKMYTYRGNKLLSIKKATKPTPYKLSTKKQHVEAREKETATKKKGARDLFYEFQKMEKK
ncbi:hypothetical protein B9Z55_028768 [Caenorhabditis nigoni]|uniref:Uncharacterized protein n=1 Tax=Caenorhabditis nigoni TaxID=1611254 RepID=A0A2G5SAF4_9PELO|nr:hypothetical protein B9Z55_028768 [Caenorhabditis nigoni]